MPTPYNVVGYETLTIADSAAKLTAVTAGKSFVGRLETAQVRARGDGTDPTSSEGVLIEVGDTVILSASEIDRTSFIRTGSTSGVLKGEFYSVEASVFVAGSA
jgi:hypothetical protein